MEKFDENLEIKCKKKWFDLIKKGTKTVEGRLNIDKFCNWKENDKIKLLNRDDVDEFVCFRISKIVEYPTFKEMLETETIAKVLPDPDIDPHVASIDWGVTVYREFYTEEVEKAHGVIAIHIELDNNGSDLI